MAPQRSKKQSPRHKPVFRIKDIIFFGIPFWVGMPLISWYFKQWQGALSSLIGLAILSLYLASEIFIDKKTRRMQGSKAVKLIALGFAIRLMVLLAVSFLLYYFLAINLLFFLLTVAFGFTAMIFISIRNWL